MTVILCATNPMDILKKSQMAIRTSYYLLIYNKLQLFVISYHVNTSEIVLNFEIRL